MTARAATAARRAGNARPPPPLTAEPEMTSTRTAQFDSEHTAHAAAADTGVDADVAADVLVDAEVLDTAGAPCAILAQGAGDALADAEVPSTADLSHTILVQSAAEAPGTVCAAHGLLCADHWHGNDRPPGYSQTYVLRDGVQHPPHFLRRALGPRRRPARQLPARRPRTRRTPSLRQGLSPGPNTTPPHIHPATTTRIPRYP